MFHGGIEKNTWHLFMGHRLGTPKKRVTKVIR